MIAAKILLSLGTVLATTQTGCSLPETRHPASSLPEDRTQLPPRPTGNLNDLETELRRKLAANGVEISRKNGRLTITMPADILFTSGQAVIDTGRQQQLDLLAQELLRGPFATIQITGHTDDSGTAEANQALSQHRAEAVAEAFLAQGWQRGLLHVMGRGASEPVASNETEEGRSRNRRVEIVVLPNF